MKLIELFESKKTTAKVPAPVTRNWVAKNAPKTGAGSHTDQKFTRKEKHKKKDTTE